MNKSDHWKPISMQKCELTETCLICAQKLFLKKKLVLVFCSLLIFFLKLLLFNSPLSCAFPKLVLLQCLIFTFISVWQFLLPDFLPQLFFIFFWLVCLIPQSFSIPSSVFKVLGFYCVLLDPSITTPAYLLHSFCNFSLSSKYFLFVSTLGSLQTKSMSVITALSNENHWNGYSNLLNAKRKKKRQTP